MAIQTLPTEGLTQVRITSQSGPIRVIAEERSDVEVPSGATATRSTTTLTVTAGSDALLVRVPHGMDLVIGTESSRVKVNGSVGALAVATRSGRASVDSAMSADVRTTSGRVDIGTVVHACRIRTESGAVDVDACGAADVATESGRIRLKGVDGPVHAHCTSGRIQITLSGAHAVDAETVSGRIDVSVPPGAEPEVTTGHAPTAEPAGPERWVITTRSVSGRVKVTER